MKDVELEPLSWWYLIKLKSAGRRGSDTRLFATKDEKATMEVHSKLSYKMYPGHARHCFSICLRYQYRFDVFEVVERLQLPTAFWEDREDWENKWKVFGELGEGALTHRIKIDYKNSCAKFSQYLLCMCKRTCHHDNRELELEGSENSSCMLVGRMPEEAVWQEMIAINEDKIKAEVERLRKKPEYRDIKILKEI